ncbi:hypothetical protein [Synechococcus sp. 1G10]|uniref:hypothetical protein n=1 Tax=Synechococcus sp. 1G10 TaxID=2025605 RepID=UPI0018E90B1B|nr:hypothetical protein [Synechococcus sp. 1G10]
MAELQQLIALGVAQLACADKAVNPTAVGGDAVAGEHLAHLSLDTFGVVIDLGHVLAEDPAGDVLHWGGAPAAQQFHQHQWLVDVAHAHPPRHVVA